MTEVPFAVVVRTCHKVANDEKQRRAVEERIRKTIGRNCPPVIVIGHDDDVELLTLGREECPGEEWKDV